jgi:hypothetical protein
MKPENWIAIAAIIAALAAPLLQVWLQNRLVQAKVNPATNKPKKPITLSTRLARSRLATVAFSTFGIFTILPLLVIELSEPEVITPWQVFNIALYIGLILFHLLFAFIMTLIQRMNQLNRLLMDAQETSLLIEQNLASSVSALANQKNKTTRRKPKDA